MPRSNLVDAMKASVAARVAAAQTDDAPTSSPVPLQSSDIPEAPDLPPMLNPDDVRNAWHRDQERITMQVSYGLELFGWFTGLLEEHQKEGRKAQPERATEPRARAQQIVDVLKARQERYEPTLNALLAWHQRLGGTRGFRLTTQAGVTFNGLKGSIEEALRALRRPLNDLRALPPLPSIPRADDEAALETALNVARHVKAIVAEHQQAPEQLARYLFGIRNAMTRIVDIVDAADNRMTEMEPSPHGLTRFPSIYPIKDAWAIPQGKAEHVDTSALGQHDPFFLP